MKIFNFSLDWFKNEKIFSIYPLIYCVSWADNQHHIFKLNWRAWDYYVSPVFGSKINILFSWSWSKSLPQIKFQLPGCLSPEQLLIIIQQFWIKLHKTLSYYMNRSVRNFRPTKVKYKSTWGLHFHYFVFNFLNSFCYRNPLF